MPTPKLLINTIIITTMRTIHRRYFTKKKTVIIHWHYRCIGYRDRCLLPSPFFRIMTMIIMRRCAVSFPPLTNRYITIITMKTVSSIITITATIIISRTINCRTLHRKRGSRPFPTHCQCIPLTHCTPVEPWYWGSLLYIRWFWLLPLFMPVVS